ncbi:MAG: cysteine desulfurase family protein [Nitrospinaceae bacterium]
MKKIYLDHNATTPLDPRVLEVMLPLLRDEFGNPSSVHSEGRRVRVKMDEAREQVAELIGAHPGEIVFTSGGTESDNFAILGAALALKDKGRHIITSRIEHPAVLNPCRQLERLGFHVDRLEVDPRGRVDSAAVRNAIGESTILITIQHANNEVGTLQDIRGIGEIARGRGVLFHTDAVQSVGKMAVNVRELPVDLLSFSAHKFYGPKGTGALYIKKGCPGLFPLISGGGQEKKRRGGTENAAGIIGFGKACELARTGLESGEPSFLEGLRSRFYRRILESLADVELFGDRDRRLPNTLNLSFEGADGETLLIGLDMEGIAVSTGSACSSGSALPSHVLTAMKVSGERINASLRISLGRGNTPAEMDRVSETLIRLVKINRKRTAAPR